MDWLGILGIDDRLRGLRRLAAATAVAAEDRFELFTLELDEEKERLAKLVVLAVLAAALAIVTFTVFSVAVMVHFWDSGSRVQAAWCVSGLWIVIWSALVIALYRTAQKSSGAFPLTRHELARDWGELKEHL